MVDKSNWMKIYSETVEIRDHIMWDDWFLKCVLHPADQTLEFALFQLLERDKLVQDVSNDEENKAEKNKADAKFAEKQARNVQTSLTLSSAELKIQSMVDLPNHQEDPTVQKTPLIDTVILMVTEKTTSIHTPPTTQAQVQMCLTSCWKGSSREAWNALLVQGKQRRTNDCCR
ncbi:hypothetical protein Tco_0502249 [Tanacetum coccineum]